MRALVTTNVSVSLNRQNRRLTRLLRCWSSMTSAVHSYMSVHISCRSGSSALRSSYITGQLASTTVTRTTHIICAFCFKSFWKPRGNHYFSAIVQAWRFSLFSHITRMPDETDAKILTAAPFENWRTPSYYVDEDYPAGPECPEI